MFCRRCGAQMENNVVFCPECGTAVLGAEDKTVASPDNTVVADATVREKLDKTVAEKKTVREDFEKTVAAPITSETEKSTSSAPPKKRKKVALPIAVSVAIIAVLVAGALVFKDDIAGLFEKDTSRQKNKSYNGEETTAFDDIKTTLAFHEKYTYADSENKEDYLYVSGNEEENVKVVLEYIKNKLPSLDTTDAAVRIGLSKGIVKIKNENGEEIPFSDNDTLNASVNTLSKYMLVTSPTEDGQDGVYVGMDKTGQIVVFDGETEYGEVTLYEVIPYGNILSLDSENVEKAVCVDEGSVRTITVTLKDALLPQTVQNIYNQGVAQEDIKSAVLAELATADDFMKVVEPENIVVSYDNCQLVITINLETDEITAIEYIKRANISTKVVGVGTMEGLEESPLTFCYESFLKYEIDRNKNY